ncbi:hypothetical protein ACVH9Z_27805 [Rhodococcus opacus]
MVMQICQALAVGETAAHLDVLAARDQLRIIDDGEVDRYEMPTALNPNAAGY